MIQLDRTARLSNTVDPVSAHERRTPFQRDRDRVLYSDHFRRLSGVTQVASAVEGGIFHNRLTHSIKVAQVGRRLAELLLDKHGKDFPELHDCLSPDVVEAAALAHDLGHPPFGHVADEHLCKLAVKNQLPDGFEGNAQTFRIATRLSVRRGSQNSGLDLTRATLAAIAKYPWQRARGEGADKKREKKFSFFDDDLDAGAFALQGLPSETKTLECQIMDLADAITYSVHDLEDFYRAGLVPVERLVRNEEYRLNFLRRWERAAPDDPTQQRAQSAQTWSGLKNILSYLLSDESEQGSRSEAALLDGFRSVAISHFVGAVELSINSSGGYVVKFSETAACYSKFLQRLIWDYVILSPRLATQQAGQIRVIDGLFQYFLDSLIDKRVERLPTRFREDATSYSPSDPMAARMAIDIVSTLTEVEAISLFKRISGYDGGSILDMVN